MSELNPSLASSGRTQNPLMARPPSQIGSARRHAPFQVRTVRLAVTMTMIVMMWHRTAAANASAAGTWYLGSSSTALISSPR